MAKRYDLVVIGTGVAGTTAAYRCKAAGWSVAIVDHLPFGGTCALRGCDPKRVLASVTETLDLDRRMRGKGIGGGEPAIDWPELMSFKRTFTEQIPALRERQFSEEGIDAFHCRARFRDQKSIEANGEVLEARFFLIASGSVPIRLHIPGEEHLATSADFLDLGELPRRLVLVGGGYIAAEFSHIAIRAGARVSVIEREDRILPQFDPDLVDLLIGKSRALGIDLKLGTTVEVIGKEVTHYSVTISRGEERSSLEADLAVHAAGRAPDLDGLDLEAGGIAVEKGRLKLSEHLQSVSNPAVYAAGDAASAGPQLTPIASYDGGIAAANMLEGNRRPADYSAVPSIAFTSPPLARAGLLEEQARKQNLKFRVRHEKTSSWYTARRLAEECSGFKVLIEEETGRILGAHLIGPHADEVINVFAVAIKCGLTAYQLKDTLFGYPTAGADIGSML